MHMFQNLKSIVVLEAPPVTALSDNFGKYDGFLKLKSPQGPLSENSKNPNGFPQVSPGSTQRKLVNLWKFYSFLYVHPGCLQRKPERIPMVC